MKSSQSHAYTGIKLAGDDGLGRSLHASLEADRGHP